MPVLYIVTEKDVLSFAGLTRRLGQIKGRGN